MTIYQLFEREDIYSIIEKTLKEYYSEVHGLDVDVSLSKNRLCNHFVVYPRIGVIISRVPTWEVMKHVYADFNVQGSLFRKIIAWGYITLCWCTFGLLGDRSLHVSNKRVLHRNISIMACNKKIRIFDFKNRYIDAILKVGYPDNYFKNEIKARTTLRYPFIPGIEKNGERWYRENVLEGSGLVRTSPEIYQNYCDEVISDIRHLFNDFGREMSSVEYGRILEEKLKAGFEKLRKQKGVEDLSYIQSILNRCLEIINSSQGTIPLTLSHGDLQTGNIIVDDKNKKVTIYDWETVGERSVWFDCSRLLLYSARREHFINMANHYEEENVRKALLSLDDNKERNMKVVMVILMLEEMRYRVDEMLELPEKIGADEMADYEGKMKEIVWLN